MRTIKTNAGLGDSVWLFQKLINAKEQFHWKISDKQPQRGKQIFDLLPQLSLSCTYTPGLNYAFVNRSNMQKIFKDWKRLRLQEFFLSANEWLEQGHNLREFFPDLPISYKLTYATNEWRDPVKQDFQSGHSYIGIYGSSYSTSRAWGFWEADKWFNLIQLIHKQRKKAIFVIIGAEWDMNLSDDLVKLLKEAKIPHINTVGKPLGYVMEMMKILSYAFYFPSGLPIISQTIVGASDCMMFYPPPLKLMQGTWADPQNIENKSFYETQFVEPEEAFSWAKDEYKLLDKI